MVTKQQEGWFLFLILFCHDVLCVHHWRLSDDGKKIEAVHDTPYNLGNAGSLSDFLRQHDDVKKIGKSFKELQKTLASITDREKIDEPNIESRVRKESAHCQKAGSAPLLRSSFQSTYSAEVCEDYHYVHKTYIELVKSAYGGSTPKGKGRVPSCGEVKGKGFLAGTKYDFSHINLPNSEDSPDPEYVNILNQYFDGFIKFSPKDPAKYGEILAELLLHSSDEVSRNPYLFMAIAAYWRIRGNLHAALNCYKTISGSISATELRSDVTIQKLVEVQLVSTAVLLNKAEQPKAAANLINWFRDTQQPFTRSLCFLLVLHIAAADATASLSDEQYTPPTNSPTQPRDATEAALLDYKQAVKLEGQVVAMANGRRNKLLDHMMVSVKKKANTLQCQEEITQELEKQRENLEKLLSDKLHYNEVFGEQVEIEREIFKRMVGAEKRLYQTQSYEMKKYGYNPHRECKLAIVKRFPYSNNPNNIETMYVCSPKDEKAYEAYLDPQRKATLKNRPPLNNTAWKVVDRFTKDRNYEKKLLQLKGKKVDKPQAKPKYPLDDTLVSSVKDRFWRRADWPTTVDCQAVSFLPQIDLFDPQIFPQTFIPLENKGFIVSDYLTKVIGLDFNEDLPFPWYEPYCGDVPDPRRHPMSTFDGVFELLEMRGSRPEWAESHLMTSLVRLADRIMEDIEVGARIRMLIQYDLAPRWLSFNLAGLYWRAKGNPREATMCLIQAIVDDGWKSDLGLVQLGQHLFKNTGRREEAFNMIQMGNGVGENEPILHWLLGRLSLFNLEVDVAISNFKTAIDCDPFDKELHNDLLRVVCSGKSSKPAIFSQFPTVCCSAVVQNAVCFKTDPSKPEHCYVVDPDTGRLIYNRCNGVYTGSSHATSPYVNIVSPLLPIFDTVTKEDRPFPSFIDDVEGIQIVDSPELPLDHGGAAAFLVERPPEWWHRATSEMRYEEKSVVDRLDGWEEEGEEYLANIPPKPLSFLWIRDKKEMLAWDILLPTALPAPTMHQIRRGLSRFPPPRQSNNMCSGVNKLSVLLENQVSTWVSVTAKGEDIEKHVDLRGPVPGIAGLQPVCPAVEKLDVSPILGLAHIPAFALSDQFLFYKPEKMLTDALKSLGNERDSIDHVAARLHQALMADTIRQNGAPVNWLLCVLSSLYWRVQGDAPKAVGCLQCALQTAPPHMRDVVLISLANMCHQAGLLHSALIAAGAALTASPNLVAIHFTIANIYASIGDYQRALDFYYSTLSLQSNFEPAKERIRAIFCHSGESFSFHAV